MRHSSHQENDATGIAGAFGSRAGPWAALLIALCAAGLLASQGAQPCDDAYITFRHVRHLIEHGRPAWNLSGEPVLGSTSPLYMALLAGVGLFSRVGDVPLIALVINTVAHFATVFLAWCTVRRLTQSSSAAGVAGVLVGVNGVCVYTAAQGFESAVYTAVVLGTFHALLCRRDLAAVVLASLAPLIRPEGILLSLLVWAVLLAGRRGRWRCVIAYSVAPLVWIIVGTAYYGSPVPHSITAKRMFPLIYEPFEGPPVDLLARAPRMPGDAYELWRTHAGSLLFHGGPVDEFTRPPAAWSWIMGAGAVGWFLAGRRRVGGELLHAAYAVLFLALFGWIGHTMTWYFPSFVATALIALVVGWSRVIGLVAADPQRCSRSAPSGGAPVGNRCPTSVTVRALGGIIGGRPRWPRAAKAVRAVALALVFMVFASVNRYALRVGDGRPEGPGPLLARHPAGDLWVQLEAQRYRGYREAAEFLNGVSAPDDRALISEVGVFGYFYHGEVIDAVGLCSPEAVAFYPPERSDFLDETGTPYSRMNNVVPARMVHELKPEFVVNSRGYMAHLLAEGHPFLDEYERVWEGARVWREPIVAYRRIAADPP
jgi:hypothetical protein